VDRIAFLRDKLFHPDVAIAPDAGSSYEGWMPRDPGPALWDEPFYDAWLANAGIDERLRYARAQAAELAAARPYIRAGELIIGNNALRPILTSQALPFCTGMRLDGERLQEVRAWGGAAAQRADEIAAFWDVWSREHAAQRPLTCHASLAWERALTLGIDGLAADVCHWRDLNVPARPEAAAWYEGLLTVLGGISAYIAAHAAAAEQAARAAESASRRAELETIAAACSHVAHRPPETFQQALQLFYLLFSLGGHDSPGPMDRYLYPALRRDLDAGALTHAQAQELLDCLYLKLADKICYGATIGGQLPDGRDASNELSLMCVDAIRRLRLLSPRTALRWHRGLSRELLDASVDSIATGATFPALVNDEAVIPAMVARGIKLEHAREYTFVGCGQVYPHGRGHGSYEDVVINAAKPLEWALNDGIDPITGERCGPATGAPETLTSWEAFESAYRAQMSAHIAAQIGDINARRAAAVGHAVDYIRSLLSWSCVERGLDWHAGGVDYSEGMVDMVGLTTVTDSLYAIRTVVYEQQRLTLAELAGILKADWVGHEALRQYLLKQVAKFGNGCDDADARTAAEVARVNAEIKSYRTVFGGPWGMDIIGWSGAVIYGEQTGATPDGRRQGAALADCAGPAQGRNTHGIAPTLEAVLRLPHCAAHGPMALSLRFPQSTVRGREGRAALRAAIETYFQGGGQHLQISIASTEEMRAAQAQPEAYADLMVRVGGFSAYFTQLEQRFQDDMIARSELEL
jgi:formate C-acetyltransferase